MLRLRVHLHPSDGGAFSSDISMDGTALFNFARTVALERWFLTQGTRTLSHGSIDLTIPADQDLLVTIHENDDDYSVQFSVPVSETEVLDAVGNLQEIAKALQS